MTFDVDYFKTDGIKLNKDNHSIKMHWKCHKVTTYFGLTVMEAIGSE
jgi:hypothetical protein